MHAQRGYTAIELSVALSLAGILVAGSVFSIRSSLAREALDGWARSMTLDIAAGQQAAVTLRATVNITVTTTSYTMAVSGGNTFRNATLPADISLTTTCSSNVCAFDRRGVPLAAGTITLTSALAKRSYVVTINPTTGSVSYQ
ncbi:MAG TPA: GspH/FimT family pseudopilin [bacterium]|nr:GspH/FimT family pseudopilin [bacterium]